MPKVKPKRPARKRKYTVPYKQWMETVVRANKHFDKLQSAEADKRILLDENLKLQSDMRSLAIDRDYYKSEALAGGRIINELRAERDHLANLYEDRVESERECVVMLDALCRANDLASHKYQVAETDFMRVVAERDALATRLKDREGIADELHRVSIQRDDLAKRNQELEGKRDSLQVSNFKWRDDFENYKLQAETKICALELQLAALAKRNQELEAWAHASFPKIQPDRQEKPNTLFAMLQRGAQNFQWPKDKSRRKLPPIGTTCQMEFSESKGVKP